MNCFSMFDHFVEMVLKGLRDWQGPEYTSGDNERDNAIFIVDSRQIFYVKAGK